MHYLMVSTLLRTADAKLLETVGRILEYCFVLGLCSWRRFFEGEKQKTKKERKRYTFLLRVSEANIVHIIVKCFIITSKTYSHWLSPI